jgi:hypothetical protein
MPKRRTSGIQRRARTLETPRSGLLELDRPDWRLWAVAGAVVLALAAATAVAIAAFGSGPAPGRIQPDGGAQHIADGTSGGPYTSVPATSGPHWGTPAQWNVYTTPVSESQVLHNLEHAGIVIWYQPDQLDDESLGRLTSYVRGKLSGSQFKFILSPWAGADFGAPIAVTAWRYLLYLDEVDTGQIDAFVGAYYGRGPEPGGGPGPPPR